MVSYHILKKKVIDLIDDQATKYDVLLGYGSNFSANTSLDEIGVTAPDAPPILMMSSRFIPVTPA